MHNRHIVMLTTCPDMDCAETVAAHLIDNQLASCVNIVPGVRSIYRWQGETHQDNELLLLIKTRTELSAAVQAAIVEVHPYQQPEAIALPIQSGLAGYLAWIDDNTATPQ
ncbi:MAG: divalent-cation tolerance protein CutA [Gammaproteobacteria bacterium]|nr:divalent-cation tolerance protein CutA [Gammaproteobacteria bacterium]